MTETTAPTTDIPSRKPYLFVLQCGLATTLLALAGVWWLSRNTEEFNIMGWYANYVFPIGAIIVGFVAGSGYALASWFVGLRISGRLLLTILILQAAAYVAAEYVEYHEICRELEREGLVFADTGELPSFLQYYDFKARSFAWKKKYSGDKQPEPLGGWGYLFLGLAAIGFIGAGIAAPAFLRAVPYCEACQRYMKSKVVSVLPGSVPARKVPKSDSAAQQAYAQEQAQAAAAAEGALARLRTAASAGDADAFGRELSSAGDVKSNNKLPRRVEITLIWCRECEVGRIQPVIAIGKGDKTERTKLEQMPVSAEFVRALLASRAGD